MKLAANRICVAPRRKALTLMNWFIGCSGFRNSYSVGSKMRRMCPAIPRMCIGKKVRLKNRNDSRACTVLTAWFIMRPNIFGYQ